MVEGIKGITGIKGLLGSRQTLFSLQSTYENFLLGTHLFNLYYGTLIENATPIKILWPESFSSTITSTTATEVPSELTQSIDIDFDSKFQTERLIGGVAKINGTGTIEFGSFLDGSTAYVIAKLRKVSGGVETDIGTAQSETKSADAPFSFNLLMNVTRTNFSAEDILRLTFEVWTTRTAQNPADSYVSLNHLGNNKIQIPFVNTNEY